MQKVIICEAALALWCLCGALEATVYEWAAWPSASDTEPILVLI